MGLEIFPIIIFFLYTFGLGYSITKFVIWNKGFLERNIMRIGLGIAATIILGFILNLVSLPVDWRIILLVALLLFPIALSVSCYWQQLLSLLLLK